MGIFAFYQHRLGRTDGVSLEVDKWRKVLEKQGHKVWYIAGNQDVPGGKFIPELYPFHEVTSRIIKNATVKLEDYPDGKALIEDVYRHSRKIKSSLERILEEIAPDVILPNNIFSVGYNLPGMLAMYEILEVSSFKVICHSHDFWWEEESKEVHPTCKEVVDFYMKYAPPDLPGIKHVVINTLAQRELKRRRNIDSVVIPNVFDFNQREWKLDDYNYDLRAKLGLSDSDIVFLQATRILDRKAIELSIDVVREVKRRRSILEGKRLYNGKTFTKNDRIVLLSAGYVEGIGAGKNYFDSLVKKAEREKVDVIWAADIISFDRKYDAGKKFYSLWDSYAIADIVTYPSIWEGWGNQFIEAVFARLPVVVFEYPVFKADIKPKGFKIISLGDKIIKDSDGLLKVDDNIIIYAAEECIQLLLDGKKRKEIVDTNFEIGRLNYSLEVLDRIISSL